MPLCSVKTVTAWFCSESGTENGARKRKTEIKELVGRKSVCGVEHDRITALSLRDSAKGIICRIHFRVNLLAA